VKIGAPQQHAATRRTNVMAKAQGEGTDPDSYSAEANPLCLPNPHCHTVVTRPSLSRFTSAGVSAPERRKTTLRDDFTKPRTGASDPQARPRTRAPGQRTAWPALLRDAASRENCHAPQ
jgi:hypothetical protein